MIAKCCLCVRSTWLSRYFSLGHNEQLFSCRLVRSVYNCRILAQRLPLQAKLESQSAANISPRLLLITRYTFVALILFDFGRYFGKVFTSSHHPCWVTRRTHLNKYVRTLQTTNSALLSFTPRCGLAGQGCMGKQTNLIRLGALPRVKTKFSEGWVSESQRIETG